MPKPIYWTLVDSYQAPLETQGYLSPAELQKFASFRFPKRRNEWLLGCWTAKALAQSIPAYQQPSLDQIEICNTPEGAPYIQLTGKTTPVHCLSISHSNSFAMCALAPGQDVRVGADLEKIEARTETFILDYFTTTERQLVDICPAETRAVVVTLIWSMKESMLKALGVGLRRDTRSVEVRSVDGLLHAGNNTGKWQRIQIGEQNTSNRAWTGWWQRRDQFALTLAAYAATQAGIQSVHLVEKKFL